MKLGRVLVYGGSIAGIAAWAHLATEGLLSAAGLVTAVFAMLVIVGLSLAVLAQPFGPGSWASVVASVRRVRNRRSLHDACGVCARAIVDNGPFRVCRSCDRIPATLTP